MNLLERKFEEKPGLKEAERYDLEEIGSSTNQVHRNPSILIDVLTKRGELAISSWLEENPEEFELPSRRSKRGRFLLWVRRWSVEDFYDSVLSENSNIKISDKYSSIVL